MRPPALVMRLAAVLSTTSAALRARQMSPFQARTPEPAAPWERSTAAVPEGVQRQRRWQRFSVGAVRPAPRSGYRCCTWWSRRNRSWRNWKAALIAFLESLTDTEFLSDPRFQPE